MNILVGSTKFKLNEAFSVECFDLSKYIPSFFLIFDLFKSYNLIVTRW